MNQRRLQALAGVLVPILVLTACGSNEAATSRDTQRPVTAFTSKLLAPAQFDAAIAEPRRFTINVHVPFEGSLPHTDARIPYNKIRQAGAKLPADRSTSLAVYCRSGRMSAIAATTLNSLGYTDIVELKGGFEAWQAGGRQLEQDPRPNN